jgi:hypothetical protein
LAIEIIDRQADAALKIIARPKLEAVYRPIAVEAVEVINFAITLATCEFRLSWAPADLRPVRPGAALQPPELRLKRV